MSEWEQFKTEQVWRGYFWCSQELIKSLQEKADKWSLLEEIVGEFGAKIFLESLKKTKEKVDSDAEKKE